MERTFSMIKPDAVKAGHVGGILAVLEKEGFKIRGLRMTHLSKAQAGAFYAVHRERPFYASLVTFMTEGPVVAIVLDRADAVKKLREVMGATNPANAAEGTIRKQFAGSIQENAIHGSDAEETAAFEIGYWFAGHELI